VTPKNLILSVTFDPPDADQPPNTVGGASRDGISVCLPNNVVPQFQNLSTSANFLPLIRPNNYGLTISDRPNFYA
jgi:hypothetical protein